MASGIGYDRAAQLSEWVQENHCIPRVITNLAVLDFDTADNRMRLQSVHPGVSIDEVADNTGFGLVVPDDVPTSRVATHEELAMLDHLDPQGQRYREVPDA